MRLIRGIGKGVVLPFRVIGRFIKWWNANDKHTGLSDHGSQKIELHSRPIEEAIEWLQKLGEILILSFIEPSLVDTDAIDALFDSEGEYSLLFSGAVLDRERKLSEEVVRAINSRHQDINTWQGITVFEIERRLGLHIHGYNIPHELWQLLSIRAWESPVFVDAITQKIEASVNGRLFYEQGQIPIMRFHRNTIWLLLAGYPLKSSERNYIDPHIKYFQALAHDIALQSLSWAEYCDQWILWQAHQQWEETNNWTDRAKKDIHRLPIHNQTNTRYSHILVPNDWKTNIPPWFNNFKTLNTALHTERTQE
jgi:hypothetical protein